MASSSARPTARAERRFDPVALKVKAPISVSGAALGLSGEPVSMGLVTDLFGVSARTIRFYEDAGLIHPQRNAWNRRVYGPREREQLETIILLRRAGVSLDDIREVLAAPPGRALARAAELVDDRAVRLEAELAEVEAIRQALSARETR